MRYLWRKDGLWPERTYIAIGNPYYCIHAPFEFTRCKVGIIEIASDKILARLTDANYINLRFGDTAREFNHSGTGTFPGNLKRVNC